jgi:hypothetical protein
MHLQTQDLARDLVRSLKILAGMIAIAILAASVSITKAQAGNIGGVRAPSPAMAAKTSPSSFNQVANQVRPAQQPSMAKEPCRGRHCPNHWPHHQH